MILFLLPLTAPAQWVHIAPCRSGIRHSLVLLHDSLVVASCGDSIVSYSLSGKEGPSTALGPERSDIRTLYSSGRRLYVADAKGVSSWSLAEGGWKLEKQYSSTPNVTALLVAGARLVYGTDAGQVVVEDLQSGRRSEQNPSKESAEVSGIALWGKWLLTSTIGAGMFRSGDGGRSWIPSNDGMESAFLYSVVASAGGVFAGPVNGSVVVSTNGGNSWTLADEGLPFTAVRALASYGGNIFAGTWGKGFFLSTNSGASWKESNVGLPGEGSYDIQAICVGGESVWIATGDGLWRRSLWELCSPLEKRFDRSIPEDRGNRPRTSARGKAHSFQSESGKRKFLRSVQ